MNERVVYEHELDDERKVIILLRATVDLETLEVIEQFCHRQRVKLCRHMQERLSAPVA